MFIFKCFDKLWPTSMALNRFVAFFVRIENCVYGFSSFSSLSIFILIQIAIDLNLNTLFSFRYFIVYVGFNVFSHFIPHMNTFTKTKKTQRISFTMSYNRKQIANSSSELRTFKNKKIVSIFFFFFYHFDFLVIFFSSLLITLRIEADVISGLLGWWKSAKTTK